MEPSMSAGVRCVRRLGVRVCLRLRVLNVLLPCFVCIICICARACA